MESEIYIKAQFEWNGRTLTVMRAEYQYGSFNQPAYLCFDDADPECSVASGNPYGVLSVNLNHPATEHEDDDNLYMQFVDVNNWPGIEDILDRVMWCQSARAYCQSGFVRYPIYIFSPDIEHI